MKRFRRIAWIAGTALAALGLAAAGPAGSGRVARAQSAPSAESTPKTAAPADQAMAPAAPAAPEAKPGAAPQALPQAGAGAGSSAAPLKLSAIKGEYDIDELRKLIDVARESGFTEQQVHEITVEDAQGHTINALDFLQAYDRRKKEEAARLAAEQSKVYLAPKDIIKELDKKQPQDLNQLRDKMLFVE